MRRRTVQAEVVPARAQIRCEACGEAMRCRSSSRWLRYYRCPRGCRQADGALLRKVGRRYVRIPGRS